MVIMILLCDGGHDCLYCFSLFTFLLILLLFVILLLLFFIVSIIFIYICICDVLCNKVLSAVTVSAIVLSFQCVW